MTTYARLQPCILLQEAGIPCRAWFEDALAFHGVPTDVFSLYLLVIDTEQAGQVLIQDGWTDAPEPPETLTHFLLWHPEVRRRRLNPPAPNPTVPHQMVSTVLLPAADWNLSTKEIVWADSSNQFYPSLSTLVNSLISKLLDAPHDSQLQSTMALYVLYLYSHVKSLKVHSFIDSISHENRQFHIDAVSCQPVGTLPMIAYEREIRAELRRGDHELQETSR